MYIYTQAEFRLFSTVPFSRFCLSWFEPESGEGKREERGKKKKKIKRVRGNRINRQSSAPSSRLCPNRLHTTYLGGVHVAPNRFTLSCTVMFSCSYLSLDIFDFYSPSIPFIRPLEPRRPLRLWKRRETICNFVKRLRTKTKRAHGKCWRSWEIFTGPVACSLETQATTNDRRSIDRDCDRDRDRIVSLLPFHSTFPANLLFCSMHIYV